MKNRQLQVVAPPRKLLELDGRSFLVPACGGSLSLECSGPVIEGRAPMIGISLKRPGEGQQGCEFRTQRRRVFVPVLRQSHVLAECCQLAAQLLVFGRQRAWTVIWARRPMPCQRVLNRRRRAIDGGF
ncbi:MAG TPA: hypothetical protein VGF91_14130 [Solirubrobacteraceae bacterium]